MSERESGTFLVAGLGNPGREYRKSRHNVGFMLVDLLSGSIGQSFSRMQFDALTADGRLHGRKVILAKPQLMMNKSGRPIVSLIRYFKIPQDQVLIAYDELDLPLGRLRMRPSGSSGGHQGLQDVLDHFGEGEIARLRIGIGRPPGNMDPADYVLRDFTKLENSLVGPILDRAAECVRTFILDGIDTAMNDCNEPISL